MRLDWWELEAVRRANEPMGRLLELVDAENVRGAQDYYEGLPVDVERALGYFACLCDAAEGLAHRPGLYLARDPVDKILSAHRPVSFLGWAGWHNDVGPAYLLEGACLCDQASGLFYTDDDIAHCERLARMRAGYVERESSGIADVRVERLARLRRLDRDLEGESWCITFALDEARQRPVPVLGDEVEPTGSAAVLVLPWAGEFECMLGEVVGGDTDNAFVLACDGYCMK